MKRSWFAQIQYHPGRSRLAFVVPLLFIGISPAGAQEQLIKLRVGLGDVSLNKVPFVAAYEAGIYKKNGLDVEQFITPSAADVARRSGVTVPKEFIRAGGRDTPIVIGGGSPLIVRWTTDAQADDRVIVACTDPVVRWRIIARPDITNIEQLKGKRLGYSGYGAVTHFVALSFAKIMGWNPEQDLSLMSGANTMDALKSGRVDAIIASELHETMALSAGYKILVDLAKYNIPNAGSGVSVSRAWLKDNQEASAPVRQVHGGDDRFGETKQAGGFRRHGQMVQRDRPGKAGAILPGSFEPAAQAVSVGRGNQKSHGDLQHPRDAQVQTGRLLR